MGKITLDEFIQTWESQIAKIEKQALDGDAVYSIKLKFDLDKSWYKMFSDEKEAEENDMFLRLHLLESKLTVALETAHSRFRLENRGALAKAFSGLLDKLPKKGEEDKAFQDLLNCFLDKIYMGFQREPLLTR